MTGTGGRKSGFRTGIILTVSRAPAKGRLPTVSKDPAEEEVDYEFLHAGIYYVCRLHICTSTSTHLSISGSNPHHINADDEACRISQISISSYLLLPMGNLICMKAGCRFLRHPINYASRQNHNDNIEQVRFYSQISKSKISMRYRSDYSLCIEI